MAGNSPGRARHLARELLVKALYQWQVAEHELGELIGQFETLPAYARADQQYFRQMLAIVMQNSETLDRSISDFSDRGIEQLDSVGRSILRLAFAELERRPDVPAKVVINEAVELAKRYAAADSFRFVNAVLDKAAKDRLGGEADREGRKPKAGGS
ncbi:MAG TPA: transcription antitermination factor NusB [Gammaproteobacteria bacterium]|nr:transcription antitermination factor NusB [Gammaproteobacteria bacterium]